MKNQEYHIDLITMFQLIYWLEIEDRCPEELQQKLSREIPLFAHVVSCGYPEFGYQ